MLMKLTCCTLLLAGGFVAGTQINPQDEKDMEKMIAVYEKAAQPTEIHKGLASWAGKWEQKGECPMGPISGTVEYKSVLGGRFLVGEGTSKTQMGDKAMEWQSCQVSGYDNVTKQYQTVWFDSMGTGIYLLPGTAEDGGKKITYQTQMKDAMTPNGRPFKVVVTIDGEDKHTTELWDSKKDGKTLVKEATIVETRMK
jgi:hypothetical protein